MLKNSARRQTLALALIAFCFATATASSQTQACVSFAAATQAESNKIIICGFPLPVSASSGDNADVPVACHRQAIQISKLLNVSKVWPSVAANTICYMLVNLREHEPPITTLNTSLVAKIYPDVPNTRRIRLLDSVAELVGNTESLTLSGPLSVINPAVFSEIGPTQKDKIKFLILAQTEIQTIDLSLLQPLALKHLVLAFNKRLTRITNFKDTSLPTLDHLILWGNNDALLDCRNMLSLPSEIKKVSLFQNNLTNNCALCHLPRSCEALRVLTAVERDLGYVSVQSSSGSELPYPLMENYSAGTFFVDLVAYKEEVVNKTATALACRSICSCEKWQPSTTPKPENNAAVESGPVAGNAVNSGGTAGSGASKERQSTSDGGGTKSDNRLGASAALIVIAIALALVREFIRL